MTWLDEVAAHVGAQPSFAQPHPVRGRRCWAWFTDSNLTIDQLSGGRFRIRATAPERHCELWTNQEPTDADIRAACRFVGLLPGDTDEGHIIDLRQDGWTIQHPLACRPNLFACPVNRVARLEFAEPPATLGRFQVELSSSPVAKGIAGDEELYARWSVMYDLRARGAA